jgi:hypothetical protein
VSGLGRKVFTAGEILEADQVNGYLMDQSVMVFDDATARGSAIPSPSEGMLTYNKDTSGLELYDGSAFGPVGSDAGLIHIETQDFSAVSAVNFSVGVFSATYNNYKIIFRKNSASTSNQVFARLRVAGVDNSTNYDRQIFDADNTQLTGLRQTSQTSVGIFGDASNIQTGILEICNPFLTTKTNFFTYGNRETPQVTFNFTLQTSTSSFDSISFIASEGNMTGQMSVYGYRK